MYLHYACKHILDIIFFVSCVFIFLDVRNDIDWTRDRADDTFDGTNVACLYRDLYTHVKMPTKRQYEEKLSVFNPHPKYPS